MQNEDELKAKMGDLEKKKGMLLDRIRAIKRRLHYKQYEQKALEPFLEKTKTIRIGPLRKEKRILEFRIATQAYTPGIERELLKGLKVIDKKMQDVQEIEKARRKKKFVADDIVQAEKELTENEAQLKGILEEIKRIYGEVKAIRSIMGSGVRVGGFKDDITLADISVIEQEKK